MADIIADSKIMNYTYDIFKRVLKHTAPVKKKKQAYAKELH